MHLSDAIVMEIMPLRGDEPEDRVRRSGGTPLRRTSSPTRTRRSEEVDKTLLKRRKSFGGLFSVTISHNNSEQDKQHLELFKSREFQAYLKEHHITTTNGAQMRFQQFLSEQNNGEIASNMRTSERRNSVGNSIQSFMRRSSGRSTNSLMSISVSQSAKSTYKRGTSNESWTNVDDPPGKELDTSMWSLDNSFNNSFREAYQGVIRGDTESIFQSEQARNQTEQAQTNYDVDEGTRMLSGGKLKREFFRRSSAINTTLTMTMTMPNLTGSLTSETGIDSCNPIRRRCSLFSSVGSKADMSHGNNALASSYGETDTRQSTQSSEPCTPPDFVPQDDVSRGNFLDDDDDACTDTSDRSNDGIAEFYSTRRGSNCSSYDLPPRRASIISRTSETSSQLRECLNEIGNYNVVVNIMEVLNLSTVPNSDDETESEKNEGHAPSDRLVDDNTIESESLGDEDSVSSDQAYIGYRKDHPGDELGNTASNFPRPSYPKSESFSNVYKDTNTTFRDEFMTSRPSLKARKDSLLVEWGESCAYEPDA